MKPDPGPRSRDIRSRQVWRCLRIALALLQKLLGVDRLQEPRTECDVAGTDTSELGTTDTDVLLAQESFLATARRVSTSCTGVYTAEMALAVIEKTVNDAEVLQWPMYLAPTACFVHCLEWS